MESSLTTLGKRRIDRVWEIHQRSRQETGNKNSATNITTQDKSNTKSYRERNPESMNDSMVGVHPSKLMVNDCGFGNLTMTLKSSYQYVVGRLRKLVN